MSQQHDRDAILALCEYLFEALTDVDPRRVATFKWWRDEEFGAKIMDAVAPYSKLPESLRRRLNADVERQAAAWLGSFSDLGIECRVLNDPGFGQSFHLSHVDLDPRWQRDRRGRQF